MLRRINNKKRKLEYIRTKNKIRKVGYAFHTGKVSSQLFTMPKKDFKERMNKCAVDATRYYRLKFKVSDFIVGQMGTDVVFDTYTWKLKLTL
jgi:hypothetical protein